MKARRETVATAEIAATAATVETGLHPGATAAPAATIEALAATAPARTGPEALPARGDPVDLEDLEDLEDPVDRVLKAAEETGAIPGLPARADSTTGTVRRNRPRPRQWR